MRTRRDSFLFNIKTLTIVLQSTLIRTILIQLYELLFFSYMTYKSTVILTIVLQYESL